MAVINSHAKATPTPKKTVEKSSMIEVETSSFPDDLNLMLDEFVKYT